MEHHKQRLRERLELIRGTVQTARRIQAMQQESPASERTPSSEFEKLHDSAHARAFAVARDHFPHPPNIATGQHKSRWGRMLDGLGRFLEKWTTMDLSDWTFILKTAVATGVFLGVGIALIKNYVPFPSRYEAAENRSQQRCGSSDASRK
jgi:hypothetical protein